MKVLQRRAGRPRLSRLDKLFLAAASRILPKERWSSFIVTPATLLRWHRELERRKWTHGTNRCGRPQVDPEEYALVVRMAKEDPRWGYIRIQGECRLRAALQLPETPSRTRPQGAGMLPPGRSGG